MPDLKDREKHERKLTQSIADVFREHRERYQRTGRVAPQKLNNELTSAISMVLLLIYLDSGKGLFGEFDDPRLSTSLLQNRAAQWSQRYSEQLARELTQSTLDDLAAANQSGTLSRTETGQRVFSPQRAESIGITETTRATTAGEDGARREVERQLNVTLRPHWVTAGDARVCKICSPLNGRPLSTLNAYKQGPPAHPRCRCFVRYEVSERRDTDA